MKRGRKPKPTFSKLVEGNPGRRPLNHAEPNPQVLDNLKAPAWLDRFGKDFWNDFAPKLRRLRLLTELDARLLAAAAERWSVYIRASRKLKKTLTQVSRANGRHARPEVAISKQALDSVRAILAEFGIGPASRTRVKPVDEEQKDVDPAAEFFR